jgi:TatD DNase family protein
MYTDAHLHLVDLEAREGAFWNTILPFEWRGAVVAHDIEEFKISQTIRQKIGATVCGFGIHPQNPIWDTADFLSVLASTRQIDFVGEAGFDFFGDTAQRERTAENIAVQRGIFEFQVGLAFKYSLPLLIHTRKAMDILMGYGKSLKKLPSVIFHSWPGRLVEADGLAKKGINAFFSIGTPILRDAKHSIESCAGIESSRLLAETDAPWQVPRDEPFTRREKIVDITKAMANARDVKEEKMAELLVRNFRAAFFTEI